MPQTAPRGATPVPHKIRQVGASNTRKRKRALAFLPERVCFSGRLLLPHDHFLHEYLPVHFETEQINPGSNIVSSLILPIPVREIRPASQKLILDRKSVV